MKLARALVAASLVLAAPAAAKTVHVSGSGVDAGTCGSAAAPCRTITRATKITQAGDELRVAAGIYHAGAGEKYPILFSGQTVKGEGSPTVYGGDPDVDFRVTAGEVTGLRFEEARLVVEGSPMLRQSSLSECEVVVESGAPRLEGNFHSGDQVAVTAKGLSAPEILDSTFFSRVGLLATDASRPRFEGNYADVANVPPYAAIVETRLAATPSIVGNEMTGSGATGVLVVGGAPVIERNEIDLLEIGVHVLAGLATIRDNDLHRNDGNVVIGNVGFSLAIEERGPAAILRDNRFQGCSGPHMRITEAALVDVGTPVSPGGNVFSGCVYVDICNDGPIPVITSGNSHDRDVFDPDNTDCTSFEDATAGPVYRVDP